MANFNPELVRRAVLAVISTIPELADDEQLRADMLEGETDYLACLEQLEERRAESEAMVAAISMRAKELDARKRRYLAREQAARNIMLQIMQAADLPKVTLPAATVSITKPREKLQISDPEAVPPEWCHPPVYKPDSKRIKDAMDAGQSFNWANLTECEPSITVRTR